MNFEFCFSDYTKDLDGAALVLLIFTTYDVVKRSCKWSPGCEAHIWLWILYGSPCVSIITPTLTTVSSASRSHSLMVRSALPGWILHWRALVYTTWLSPHCTVRILPPPQCRADAVLPGRYQVKRRAASQWDSGPSDILSLVENVLSLHEWKIKEHLPSELISYGTV